MILGFPLPRVPTYHARFGAAVGGGASSRSIEDEWHAPKGEISSRY